MLNRQRELTLPRPTAAPTASSSLRFNTPVYVAQALVHRILDLVASETRKANESICKRYSKIRKKLQVKPADSDELVTFMSYMESAQREDIPKLEREIRDSGRRLEFMFQNHYILPEDDLELNRTTFQWPRSLAPEFEINATKLTEEREKFEDDLRQHREQFEQRLEALVKKVEDWNTLGTEVSAPKGPKSEPPAIIKEMVEKVAAMDKELEDCDQIVADINAEEECLGE